MDETVTYQLMECVLSNFKIISLIKIIINFFITFLNKKVFRDFIWNKIYRSGVMTAATIQPFSEKNILLGCFDGTRMNPRSITEKNISLFM